MKRFLLISVLLFSALSMYGDADSSMPQALEHLRMLRGKDGFMEYKDSLLKVAVQEKDIDAQAQIYLSNVRHYTTIGTLGVKDDLKKAAEECKSFCSSRPDFDNTYYSAWNAYVTYLVNHHIFSEASIEIKNMQDRAIGQKQKSGIYFSYVALGNLNALEGLRDVAAEYYEKAIGYYEENDGDLDQLSLSAVYSNLSGCYIALERYSEAEKTLVKALETTKADSFLVNLCLLYEKQGDWDKLYETLSSVDFGKSMASATKDKFYRSYALYHSQQKEFSKAVEYASKMQSPESFSVLADVYKLKGDFENALKYRELADSIENASLLALQKTQLAETDRIFDHNRIFQEEVERRQKRNIIIIAILAFALLSVAVVSQIVQRRRKKVALILQKEHEKTLLADHHKSVFIKNMTHEMMTPLNHISGFSQLMTDENLDKDTMLEYARIVDDGARHMSRIFDNISIVASKLDELDDLSEEESVLYHINEEGER